MIMKYIYSSVLVASFHVSRDPELFKVILNYLRTRTLVISGVDVKQLLHEAEYYGITTLVKQLTLCADAEDSGCGDVLFYSYLSPPMVPMHEQRCGADSLPISKSNRKFGQHS